MSAHVKVLAKQLAERMYLPATWPNVNTIAAALELIVIHAHVPIQEAVELLIACAAERTPRPQYRCPSPWEEREISRLNSVDRFWFEDRRWLRKNAYAEFCERLQSNLEVA